MTKSLDEQIKERKQQATDRNVFGKANLVARKLGKYDISESSSKNDRETIVHVFNDAASLLEVRHTLTLSNEDRRHYWEYEVGAIEIFFKDKPVFTGKRDWITRYAPGDWENKLDAFYLVAQKEVEKEDAESARKYENERRAKEKETRALWGLEEETPHDIAQARQESLRRAAPKN